MGDVRRHVADSTRGRGLLRVALALLVIGGPAALVVAPAPAEAATGYELNASTPSKSLGGSKIPHGIAVDQTSQRIYVAITVTNPLSGTPGEIDRFESNLAAAGTFAVGEGFYTGVAVDPLTQGFYAAQMIFRVGGQEGGTPRMDPFSSSGVPGTPFALSETVTLPQIATNSSGEIFFPNAATHTVQVFNAAGVLQEEIGCAGCPGGSSFGRPVSVALDSDDNLYVVDISSDRVLKLTSSGGPYSYSSTLQSGLGAAAVGVDPSTDDVLVGDIPNGKGYHIAAYNSSGVQFDDFGAGQFSDPNPGPIPNPDPMFATLVAPQIAINATTHKVYVGDFSTAKFFIFDRVSSHAPTATIKPTSPIGQVTATLQASVNPSGHTVLECKFEYTNDADFQVNGFSNATGKQCSSAPNGASSTATSAQVSGLSPATLYRYRAKASTFAGTVTSSEGTFETLPATPATVTTEPPLSVNQNAATLKGKVNPHGGSVSSCRFEYGTSVAYGTNLSCPVLPEPVTTDVAESRSVSGLAPGTTYHFRLVVTTNAGTVQGGDVEFTTASPPQPPPLPPPVQETSVPPLTIVPPPSTVPPSSPRPLRCKKGFQKKRVKGKLKCVRKRHPKRRAHRS